MSFLPNDYKRIEAPSHYMKLGEGENTFRVVSHAVIGYEYWTDIAGKRTPNRVKLYEELPKEVQNAVDYQKQAKHFWSFVVVNKTNNEIQILQLTQKTVMQQIQGLVGSKNWGDPREYDIVITKEKTGSEAYDVKYSVTPGPKEKLDEGVKALVAAMEIDLGKLFTNEDPFELSKE